MNEAVKALRTNVLFSGTDIRAIGLTSCSANEGKSTVALQLAASLAGSGKMVLLLDTDMRKSVLYNRVQHEEPISGLSHYLSGLLPLDRILYHTDVPNMKMIFSGVQPPNPTELLSQTRFSELMTALKEHFDFVIVDAPPLGQVIDYAIEASLVDGTLLVVNAQQNSYRQLRRIKSQLEKSGGKILGVVLNKVNTRGRGGYYGKAYGKYGYGEYGKEHA
ncbi:CpsD/CapB family tyrosine-protein kinase [Butyricicoccus sp.]|uniref:CpsD/CapB family tyrosine-protein kinase n=1 Tax=Butyricicoccus sp. TaxID=2049021 RepID=UPI003F140009